jgi:hypothetical protein
MLFSMPALGSDENLYQLFSEIERSVNVHCTAVIDEIRRYHAASGYPETVFDAQRARIESKFQSADGRSFVEGGNPRSEARWKSAIDELHQLNLIEDRGNKRQTFFVTGDG